jgi:hypothetical protein
MAGGAPGALGLQQGVVNTQPVKYRDLVEYMKRVGYRDVGVGLGEGWISQNAEDQQNPSRLGIPGRVQIGDRVRLHKIVVTQKHC